MTTDKKHKRVSNVEHMSCLYWPVLIMVLLLNTLVDPVAFGTYYFLGTGNDGYYSDAVGLWEALEPHSSWEDA